MFDLLNLAEMCILLVSAKSERILLCFFLLIFLPLFFAFLDSRLLNAACRIAFCIVRLDSLRYRIF